MTENGRVCGNIAVSRSLGTPPRLLRQSNLLIVFVLGDKAYQPFVSPEPDLTSFSLKPFGDETHILVLACDGVWDVLSNEVGILCFLLLCPTSPDPFCSIGCCRHCAQFLHEVRQLRADGCDYPRLSLHAWQLGQYLRLGGRGFQVLQRCNSVKEERFLLTS